MSTATKDRIERTVTLRAPPERIWRMIAEPTVFGRLFQMTIDADAFEPAARVETTVEHPEFKGVRGEMLIDQVDPQRRFSFRWHPFAVERGVDYSSETPTTVVFDLRPLGRGTRLHLVESGFDRLPAARRAKAFEAHEEGWSEIFKSIEREVEA